VFSRQTIVGKEGEKRSREVGVREKEVMKDVSLTSQRNYFTCGLLASIHHAG